MNLLNEIEWSQRARNALNASGISTLTQLVHADGATLQGGRNVGVTTLREFVRGCVSLGFVPKWLKEVKMNFTGYIVPECPPDMEVLSGPYADTERQQLELAIAQLGSVPWCVIPTGLGYMLCRDRKGWKEVEQED